MLVDDYKDPKAWAQVILRVISDKDLQQKISLGATDSGKKYSWYNRGEAISDFILENIWALKIIFIPFCIIVA